MSEEIANQSEESPIEVERDAETEAAFESFGLSPRSEKKDVEFPNMDEPSDTLTTDEEEDEIKEEAPAPEKKYIKTKFNGEDKDFDPDDEQVPVLLQKGMNYDKVQQKLNEQQKALDEVAKLQGYNDHAQMIADLPKMRERQQQQAIDQFEEAKQKIIDDLIYSGVDEEAAREYAENNPLIQQARAAIEEKQQIQQQEQKKAADQQRIEEWSKLYATFPDIEEDSRAFDTGGRPNFFTAEMESMVNAGYKPVDAYRLAHLDKIQTQTKKTTEQRLIKEQQLGVRSAVAGQPSPIDSETTILPAQMALAEEFGVSVKGIQRQNQLIKNRR